MSTITDDGDWCRVASVNELQLKRRLACSLGTVPILICYSGGEVVAVQDQCTHLGLPLHDGRLMAGTITCPFHGACFDLKTGRAIAGPAVASLRTYEVRTVADDILVAITSP